MLPLHHRLPKQEVSPVLRNGIHVRGAFLELVYKKTTGKPRFAVIVSTKIDKRAVVRNRARRLIRESVHHLLSTIVPCDGVCIVRKNMSELSQVEVQKIILELFTQAHLI